ncbi:MAG: murein L,D-transpeptidase catalytic domain family protein [Tatlockia sp.]|nr:murein L,D-transpeptidase catalytic domain family protein [Tatlockia sp.]
MRSNLLLILAVTSTCFSVPSPQLKHEKIITNNDNKVVENILSMISPQIASLRPPAITLAEVQKMLQQDGGSALSAAVIDKILKTLKCANEYKITHNNILTIIDYSLPSNEKRLWVFDLENKKLLFNTYVSHGIKSGALLSNSFSNKFNSKSSSIGVFKTDKTYYGRHGLSLQLDGLDSGFNDNASSRSVVMHGGWYVDENFIQKYGRSGRSWGCPALPENLSSAIINTIKDDSLFVVYYPSDSWFLKSKFLNCDNLSPTRYSSKLSTELKPVGEEMEKREDVLFAKISAKHHEEPIVTMPADDYVRIFHAKAPLERMLRRQIDNKEYIALSNKEFENIAASNNKEDLNYIYFVIPVVKMVRGYYATEMHIVNLGKIIDLKMNIANSTSKSYTIDFDSKPSVHLRTTNQFIRWLGL